MKPDGIISRRRFFAVCSSTLALGSAILTGCAAASDNKTHRIAAGSSRKLTFALDYTPNTNHTGIYVAQQKGYFADENLEVTVVQSPSDGADSLVGSGQAQFGVSYQGKMANYLGSAQPIPVVAIAAIVQHNLSGIMSREEKGITRPAALANKRYATWNEGIEQAIIKTIVEADGGNFSDVVLVPYAVDDDLVGLKADVYDAVWVYESWAVQRAKIENFRYNYFDFCHICDAFDYYTPVVITHCDVVDKQGDMVRAFMRAIKKGYEYAQHNPDDAAQILISAAPEIDQSLAVQSQKFLATRYQADAPTWGVINEDRWNRFYQWINTRHLTEHSLVHNAGLAPGLHKYL